jgi:ribosomal protein S12 methylthiotransferase accessory factor
MAYGVKIIGESCAAGNVARALAGAGLRSAASYPVAVVVGWPCVDSLLGLERELRVPFLLVEDAGSGSVAVGPVFGGRGSACLRCYLARRRANGGAQCRPAGPVSSEVLTRLIEHVRAFCEAREPAHEQIQIKAAGECVRHVVLPVAGCASCRPEALEGEPLGLDALVSDRVGLVHEVKAWAGAPEPFRGAVAAGCRTDAFLKTRALNRGMAVDESFERAQARAIGESVERYCAAAMPDGLPVASSRELDGRHLELTQFGGDEDDGLRRARWVQAHNLLTSEPVWVPASAVYVPYQDGCAEAALDVQTSVGLGAGGSLEQAVRHGLAEVVERDASLRAWRHRLPVEAVPLQPFSIQGLHVTRVPDSSGLQTVVAFIESDVPPLTSTGLSARPVLEDAVRHATLEAVLTQTWLSEWMATNGRELPRVIETMIDNALAHALRPELAENRRRWIEPAHVADGGGDSASWAAVFASAPEACFVNITTPDVEAAGLKVVRVLVPGRVLADDDYTRSQLGGDATPHPFG